MPGWTRFNLEEMNDFYLESDSGSVMNTDASVSEILEEIHSWSKGNPNNRIFVLLQDEQNLAWQSFCAVLQSLSRKNEEIFCFSSGSCDLSLAAMERSIYVKVRGLRGYDRFGNFAEMPDWTKGLAERIEDLGPGDFTNFQLRQYRFV